MRIVSINAWGGARYDDLAAWLPGVGADVVCVQEAVRAPGLSGWTSFADGDHSLAQRADLVGDLSSLLPHHDATFISSDSGPVSDGDGREHRQEFGLVALVRGSLPVVGQQTAFVNGQYADHAVWPTGDRPRAAQAIRVHDRDADRFVLIVHCHGLRDPAGKGDTPARATQAKRLAELVESVREPEDFVVVAGDLNVLPDGVTHAELGALGLVDLVGHADTRTSTYTKPVRHADYLFVSDAEAVRNFEILADPEVSDHRPLILDI